MKLFATDSLLCVILVHTNNDRFYRVVCGDTFNSFTSEANIDGHAKLFSDFQAAKAYAKDLQDRFGEEPCYTRKFVAVRLLVDRQDIIDA